MEKGRRMRGPVGRCLRRISQRLAPCAISGRSSSPIPVDLPENRVCGDDWENRRTMYGESPTNRPTRGSVGDRPLCPNGLGGDRPLCPAGLGGDRPLSSRARRFCQGHAHVLPRLPRLPGPCACPPAPAGSAWDARISTWATRMSACTRLACPGRAHVYLGHVHVRPDQPPRAHGRSCRLRPATWRTTSASAGSRKPTAFVTALSLPVPPALLGRGTLLRPCDRG